VDTSHIPVDNVSTTVSGYVVYESLRILQFLESLNIPDLDKVVRTQPKILMSTVQEVSASALFLYSLFLETSVASSQFVKVDVLTNDGNIPEDILAGTERSMITRRPSTVISRNTLFSTDVLSTSGAVAKIWKSPIRQSDAANVADVDNDCEKKAYEMLCAMLLTFPAVLSINHQ